LASTGSCQNNRSPLSGNRPSKIHSNTA
jgi:hypothetical protein